MSDEADTATGRRRRRTHSNEFKAKVVAACRPVGVSIAAVAMAHGINSNLARRWVIAAERRIGGQSPALFPGVGPATFLPLSVAPAVQPTTPADIRIELRRGATTINVTWPSDRAAECSAWMRELLR